MVQTLVFRPRAVRSMGLFGRCVGIIAGIMLPGSMFFYPLLNGGVDSWQLYAALISVYPLMTVLGWDPLYAMSGGRTGVQR